MEINGTLGVVLEEGSPDDVNDDVDAADIVKPPKGRSIAHSAFSDGSAVFLSLDIEIGGEHAGIIQLSSEIVRMKMCPGRGVSQDRVQEVERVASFDSYVKPECDIWDQRCIDIHQIHPEDERIVSAHNIDDVWLQFKTWLNRHVAMSETIILVDGMGRIVTSSGCGGLLRRQGLVYPSHPRFGTLWIHTM